MGKVYRDKKGSSCGHCKPHKNGWAKKRTAKEENEQKNAEKDVRQYDPEVGRYIKTVTVLCVSCTTVYAVAEDGRGQCPACDFGT